VQDTPTALKDPWVRRSSTSWICAAGKIFLALIEQLQRLSGVASVEPTPVAFVSLLMASRACCPMSFARRILTVCAI